MFTATQRIRELREQGFEVKVRAERAVQAPGLRRPIALTKRELAEEKTSEAGDYERLHELPAPPSSLKLLARGGRVRVLIMPPDSDEAFTGESRCNPKLDNFNKKIGLEIAFGRAWRAYQEAQEQEPELEEKKILKKKKIPHGVIWTREK